MKHFRDIYCAIQAALSSKDEEVRKASEEKALLERRLHNLEKLILRGDAQTSGSIRVSTAMCVCMVHSSMG
jgi:hypothetical protein